MRTRNPVRPMVRTFFPDPSRHELCVEHETKERVSSSPKADTRGQQTGESPAKRRRVIVNEGWASCEQTV